MIVKCCVCDKVRIDGIWKSEYIEGNDFTHTYCPQCSASANVEIDEYKINKDIIGNKNCLKYAYQDGYRMASHKSFLAKTQFVPIQYIRKGELREEYLKGVDDFLKTLEVE